MGGGGIRRDEFDVWKHKSSPYATLSKTDLMLFYHALAYTRATHLGSYLGLDFNFVGLSMYKSPVGQRFENHSNALYHFEH